MPWDVFAGSVVADQRSWTFNTTDGIRPSHDKKLQSLIYTV